MVSDAGGEWLQVPPPPSGGHVIGRTAAGFILGLLIGFAGLQLALRVALYYIDGPEVDAAESRNMSVAEYQKWAAGRYERPLSAVSAAGAIVCGVLGALAFNRPVGARIRTAGRRAVGPDEPLSRSEFHQVLQACIWVPLEERSPEYVRGLAVGRLAEAQPALAKKVDDFSDHHMAALHHDLCRKRTRDV